MDSLTAHHTRCRSSSDDGEGASNSRSGFSPRVVHHCTHRGHRIKVTKEMADENLKTETEDNDPSSPDFVAYDGLTGAVWGSVDAWPGMFDYSVSADGTTMIAAAGGTVYTYTINVD